MSALDVFTRRNRALTGPASQAWVEVSDMLGLTFSPNSAMTRGRLAGHDVSISVTGAANEAQTNYTLQLDTPHAPEFSLTHAANPDRTTFEGSVAISTNDERGMLDFLTKDRRVQILTMLCRWDTVSMTSTELVVTTPGVQTSGVELMSSIEQLVLVAHSVSPCWAEVALDEGSVLDDLFNSDRDLDTMSARFDSLYKAGEVTWRGEIVQVGEVSKNGRLIMVLVGSASGSAWASKRTSGAKWGGRVVATTSINADETVRRGDIVTFTGGLRHLDAKRRMLRIEDLDTWKMR